MASALALQCFNTWAMSKSYMLEHQFIEFIFTRDPISISSAFPQFKSTSFQNKLRLDLLENGCHAELGFRVKGLKWYEEGMFNTLWKFLDVAKKAAMIRELLSAGYNSQARFEWSFR